MTVETRSHGDVKAAMAEFLRAFEAFKAANDERLKAIEAKSGEDAVLVEKIARIDAALGGHEAAIERLALKAARPGRETSDKGRFDEGRFDEARGGLVRFMRSGDARALRPADTKALVAGTDAEGGYLAPEPTERLIAAALTAVSPIRAIATVREIGATSFRKPISLGGAVAGWVGETGGRIETAAPGLASVDFPTMELYAMPAASQTLLDDAVVDVEQWLADEVQGEFAAQETGAFVAGDGLTQPKGFLSYVSAPDATRGDDEIGYVATGVAGAFPAGNPSDVLLDLVYAPKSVYRPNARFVMNRRTISAVRKFKDADGNYLWQPAVEAGAPSTLMGYPVTEAEDMPDIGADAHAVAFGDFRRGYLVVDRQGVRILRDPYTAKPYVLFYTTKRVGGGVQDFAAIKTLKFAAS